MPTLIYNGVSNLAEWEIEFINSLTEFSMPDPRQPLFIQQDFSKE